MRDNLLVLIRMPDYRWLLLPLAAALIMTGAITSGALLPLVAGLSEQLSLILLHACLCLSLLRYIIRRDEFFIWGFGLLLVLLCHELNFSGSAAGLGILLIILLRRFDRLSSYLKNPTVINLLTMGLFNYALAALLDQISGLPGATTEALKLGGHLLIGTSIVLAAPQDPLES